MHESNYRSTSNSAIEIDSKKCKTDNIQNSANISAIRESYWDLSYRKKLSQDYTDNDLERDIEFKNALYYNKDVPNNLQYSYKNLEHEYSRNEVISQKSK